METNTTMTDKHPLTDEVIEEIAHSGYIDDYGCYNYAADDLRAAADWQLEQVFEWIKDRMYEYVYEDYCGPCCDENRLLDDLKKAMRPQQQQENNQ